MKRRTVTRFQEVALADALEAAKLTRMRLRQGGGSEKLIALAGSLIKRIDGAVRHAYGCPRAEVDPSKPCGSLFQSGGSYTLVHCARPAGHEGRHAQAL